LKAHPLPDELIIGANGYLGQYLALARRGEDCLLHSRAPLNRMARQTGLPCVQEDLLQSHEILGTVAPQTVYLLARPVTQDASVLLAFLQNVQTLLRQWADGGTLRRVAFASTQLVYATPPNDAPIPTASPLEPQTPYDCHKAAMEYFLSLLAHHACGIRVEVYRLPLLAGGPPTAAQLQQQHLFNWRAAYQNGYRWSFPADPAARTWGNSWVHVDDVVNLMVRPPTDASRFTILQPVSGQLTYHDLDAFFQSRYPLPPAIGTVHLPKTTFFLQNNTACRSRCIAEAFPDEVLDEDSPS